MGSDVQCPSFSLFNVNSVEDFVFSGRQHAPALNLGESLEYGTYPKHDIACTNNRFSLEAMMTEVCGDMT